MAYYKTPIIYPTGRISQDTAKINENFTELAKSFVNEDPTTYKVINADKVDDYHANQIPMPNTIPVSDNSGKLNLNWIPQGSGSGLNADQVDGFHASQTPSANTIPVAGADGKLDAGWLPTIITGSISSNGYISFQNGLKIQWGRFTCSLNSVTLVTYPISFTSSVFSIIVCPKTASDFTTKPYDSSQYEDNWCVFPTSLSQFRFFNGFDGAGPTEWYFIAIGVLKILRGKDGKKICSF